MTCSVSFNLAEFLCCVIWLFFTIPFFQSCSLQFRAHAHTPNHMTQHMYIKGCSVAVTHTFTHNTHTHANTHTRTCKHAYTHNTHTLFSMCSCRGVVCKSLSGTGALQIAVTRSAIVHVIHACDVHSCMRRDSCFSFFRVAVCQSLSGTGALRIAGEFIAMYYPGTKVYV